MPRFLEKEVYLFFGLFVLLIFDLQDIPKESNSQSLLIHYFVAVLTINGPAHEIMVLILYAHNFFLHIG